MTFVQCWTNVEDVGLTLYKCYANVLCLLGKLRIYLLLQINRNLSPLITIIIVLNLFHQQVKSQLLGIKCVFKHKNLQMSGLKLNK